MLSIAPFFFSMFLIQAILVAMENKLDNNNNEPTREEISRYVKEKEKKIEEKEKKIEGIRADIKEEKKKIEANWTDTEKRGFHKGNLKILESSLQSLERSIAKLEDEKELLSQRQSMMEKLTLQLNQMSLGKLVFLFPCCDDPICSHFLAAPVQPFGEHHVDMSVNGILVLAQFAKSEEVKAP